MRLLVFARFQESVASPRFSARMALGAPHSLDKSRQSYETATLYKSAKRPSRARLAQSVERKALNLVVVGSSPTVGASVGVITHGAGCPTSAKLPRPQTWANIGKRNSVAVWLGGKPAKHTDTIKHDRRSSHQPGKHPCDDRQTVSMCEFVSPMRCQQRWEAPMDTVCIRSVDSRRTPAS